MKVDPVVEVHIAERHRIGVPFIAPAREDAVRAPVNTAFVSSVDKSCLFLLISLNIFFHRFHSERFQCCRLHLFLTIAYPMVLFFCPPAGYH